jgi:thioredoxin-like negative regulator of GroEL
VKFAKVNIDEAAVLAGEYEISSVPTLMVFRGGEPEDQVEGFYGPRPFKAWLDKAVTTAATDSTSNPVNITIHGAV